MKATRVVAWVAGVILFFVALPFLLRIVGLSSAEFLAAPEVLATWPVIVLVLGLIFLLRFHDALDQLIRHGKWKFGNLEVQSKSPEQSPSGVTISIADRDRLVGSFIGLQQTAEQRAQQVQQAIKSSLLWEFAFLEQFLVATTKQVLAWIAQGGNASASSVDVVWGPVITDASQRATILDVLKTYKLIEQANDKLSATKKGVAFLAYLQRPEYPEPHGGG